MVIRDGAIDDMRTSRTVTTMIHMTERFGTRGTTKYPHTAPNATTTSKKRANAALAYLSCATTPVNVRKCQDACAVLILVAATYRSCCTSAAFLPVLMASL